MRTKLFNRLFLSVFSIWFLVFFSVRCTAAHFEGHKIAQGHIFPPSDSIIWFRDACNDEEWDGTHLFDEYVPVNGNMYPIVCESYFVLLSVRKTSCLEKVTPVVVNGTMRNGSASAKAYSDKEVYDKFKGSTNSYMTDGLLDELWPGGNTDDTRAWIWVSMNPGSEKIKAECDLSTRPAAGIYSHMTMAEYAKMYGVDFGGVVNVSVSTWFQVGIKETGEIFSTKFYCHRLSYDLPKKIYDEWVRKESAIAEKAGDEAAGEAIVCPAAWYVSPESAGAVELMVKSSDIRKGLVSGGGVYRPNEKLVVKATPEKGYIFSHWEGPLDDAMDPRSPSITYVVGEEDAQFVAYFVPASEGGSVSVVPSDASVYDGYLCNGDKVVGAIQVKVAKPKKGSAKVTVSIEVLGSKKVTVKGEMDVTTGIFAGTTKDGKVYSLTFNMNGVSGDFDGFDVAGYRDLFSSKDKVEKADAENALALWIAPLNMICEGGTLSVIVAKKGKVTVRGEINGVKVSTKAQALIGEDMICILVVYSKKSVNLAFTVWLPIGGGDAEIVGFDGAIIGKAGMLKPNALFKIDGDILADIPSALTEIDGYALLPVGENVTASGSKWVVADGAKAAKVAYKKGGPTITEGKKNAGIANASGLKLTYKSKDGSFTGSFTVYALENNKLKKHKATVTGVLINGIGCGTATIKKIGRWNITIE